MNFIKRAIKNVTRRMSKSVLLVLTFFLIGNLVIVGLGVSSASESAKILTRKKMRAVVSYALDYDAIWRYTDTIEDEDELQKFYENYPRIQLSDVEQFLADDRVKTANMISTNMWYADSANSLDFVHLGNTAEENIEESGSTNCYLDENGNSVCKTYKEPYFYIKTNMFDNMIEFTDGDYSISSGRFYTKEEIEDAKPVCLISEALAQHNGVGLGDDIRLAVSPLTSYYKNMGLEEDDVVVAFEVIGIYSHVNPIVPGTANFDYCYPYENPDNMIFMPSTSMYAATLPMNQKSFDYYAEQYPDDPYYDPENYPTMENMADNFYIENATILLNDPLDVEKFVEDYGDELPQFAKLDANNEQFNTLAKPLDTLSMYANFIVWLVIINAVVIITLVTALTLKTREYEIGVLLSIGATKFKVILQFFVELAIVAVIGFSASVISGSLIAKNIGNRVLEYQINSDGYGQEEEEYDYGYIDIWNTDYSTEISIDDLIAEYEVKVSPLIIAEIYVLGLGIVFVSVIIPSIMIMRFNPKKILMNQG